MPLKIAAPCKVNLVLNILGRREDGFHELETVMHPVNLCDVLSFIRGGEGIQLTCSDPKLPVDSRNLVHRAAEAFLRKIRNPDGVSIHLDKHIPMEAGLGGGSGNAAITLLGLNEIFGFPVGNSQLETIAASLGSDIPFFLQNNPALATGRGEKIRPLDPFPALQGAAFLLVHPGFGISTAWAYQSLARFPEALNGRSGRAQAAIALLEESNLQRAGEALYNSLEAPALEKYPWLALLKEFMKEEGAPACLMSGSGSTVFAILPTSHDAVVLEEKVQRKFGPCWSAVVPA